MSNSEPIVQVHKIKRPGQNRKIINALITLIIFAVLGCSAFLLLSPKDKKFTLNSYSTNFVELMNLENTLSLTGEIDINKKESILSPYDSICTSILKRSGDSVAKGETILKLSSSKLIEEREKLETDLKKLERNILATEIKYKRAIRTKESNIKKNHRLLKRSIKDYENAKKLYEFESITLKELNSVEDKKIDLEEQYNSSVTELEHIKEDYTNDKILLDYDIDETLSQLTKNSNLIQSLTVKSTITGTLLSINIEEGEVINKHTPLFELGDLSTPFVKLNIPEKNREHISQDQEVRFRIGKKEYKGKLTQINAMAKQSSKGGPVITAEAEFINPPKGLTPGSNCGAEIVMNTTENALTLPRGPYIISGKDRYLYRVNGEKAERVKVVFGAMNNSHIAIKEGIELGDEIITSSYSEYINKEIIYLKSEEL